MKAHAPLEERVREALKNVIDPCSVFNGSQLSIFDLGMFRDVVVDDQKVVIELMLDDPTCAYAGMITHELHQAVDPIAEGRAVVLTMVVDEYWSGDRVTPHGRARLEEMRGRRRQQLLQIQAARARGDTR